MTLQTQRRLQTAPVGRSRQLDLRARMDRARLADRHEAGAELDRHARREHEPARLDPGHLPHGRLTERPSDGRRRSRQEPVLGEEPERVGMAFEVLQLRDELVVEGRHP